MKHWNLGNTTVRNPDRIKDALRIFKEKFEGKLFTEKEHLVFFEELMNNNIIESNVKLSKSSKEISGRKWAACFNQLGLSIAWKSKGKIIITDSGNALINDQITEEEIFLRQFLKYHLPSEIEDGKEYAGFDVNPFYIILKILSKLQEEGILGLTKEEISLYVITCINNNEFDASKYKIVNYRKKYQEIKGKVVKKRFYYDMKKKLISELYGDELKIKKDLINKLHEIYKKDKNIFSKVIGKDLINEIITSGKGYNTKKSQDLKKEIIKKIKQNSLEDIFELLLDNLMETKGKTLNDYADTTVRYTVKTGLLSIKGDKLIIKDDKLLLVKNILASFQIINPSEYLSKFYSSTEPILPTDNITFLHQNLINLNNKLRLMQTKLNLPLERIIEIKKISNPNLLKKLEVESEEKIIRLREKIFYKEQAKSEVITETIDYYDQIIDRTLLGGEAYRPAYLEWTTWRVFLAINHLVNEIHETRNFRIDEELNPIHHAKSGYPDMVFEYSDFVIVCEVTLRTTENQWSEDEPVPRHVAKVIEKYNKKVYGIFIAPSIDPNTVLEFYRKKRIINGKFVDINIVPLSIDQIKKVLLQFDKQRFSTNDLKILLEDITNDQNKIENPLEWWKVLNQRVEQFLL